MRICLVVPWFPSADAGASKAGIFEYRQAVEMVKRGHQYRVVAIRWPGQAAHEVDASGLEVHRVRAVMTLPGIRYPLVNLLAMLTGIKRLEAAWAPDVIVYSHVYYLTALPLLFLKRRWARPSIAVTDGFPGVSWYYGNRFVDAAGWFYSRTLARAIFRVADGVHLLSADLESYLAKMNIPAAKAFTIPRGVDTDSFKPDPAARAMRAELGIAPDDVVVLYVGRFDAVKGLDRLLPAAAKLAGDHPQLKFLFVGEGKLRQAYQSRAGTLGINAVFTGWRDDVPRLMALSDIFVLPSVSEGAANVALEASACGLPAVVTAVGESQRIVKHGETGFVVPPQDGQALAGALAELVQDRERARAMGLAAREHVKAGYSWDNITDRITRHYSAAIERYAQKINLSQAS